MYNSSFPLLPFPLIITFPPSRVGSTNTYRTQINLFHIILSYLSLFFLSIEFVWITTHVFARTIWATTKKNRNNYLVPPKIYRTTSGTVLPEIVRRRTVLICTTEMYFSTLHSSPLQKICAITWHQPLAHCLLPHTQT